MTPLQVLSAGAAKGLVLALQQPFTEAHHVEFECAFGAVGAMRDKLLAGEPCDVIVLSAKMIDALIDEGCVVAGSRRDLGRVFTGVAVPAAQPLPDIADAHTLRIALAAARGIYLPDPARATAGIHFANVLRALGIYDDVCGRLRPYPSGAVAMKAMADASRAGEGGLIGCTQVTEINYTDGVALVGLLPNEFELATMYSASVAASAVQADLAREFVSAMSAPAAIALRRDGGFVVD